MNCIKEYFKCYILGRRYVYGTCCTRKARKHVIRGYVEFLLWEKGDQKYLDGVGHTKDQWINFHESNWRLFEEDSK